MKKKAIIASLQTFFGVTKNELLFVAVLFGGLCAGIIIQMIGGQANSLQGYGREESQKITRLLDSIAIAEQTTYIGSTPDAEGVPELVAGDTVVKKENLFPIAMRKSLPAGIVDLNTASKADLSHLPGIGEATAEKIMDFRKGQPFRRPEDIMRIKGIGVKKFEKIKPYISVTSLR